MIDSLNNALSSLAVSLTQQWVHVQHRQIIDVIWPKERKFSGIPDSKDLSAFKSVRAMLTEIRSQLELSIAPEHDQLASEWPPLPQQSAQLMSLTRRLQTFRPDMQLSYADCSFTLVKATLRGLIERVRLMPSSPEWLVGRLQIALIALYYETLPQLLPADDEIIRCCADLVQSAFATLRDRCRQDFHDVDPHEVLSAVRQ